jgi:uncharacterized cupredoxin-like copper-binding protein
MIWLSCEVSVPDSFGKSLLGRACVLAVVVCSGALGAAAGSSAVTVQMADFAFALEPRSVPAGEIRFRVKNVGGVQHDFEIVGHGKSRVLETGGDEEVLITLAPGEYEYRCTVPGHAEAGMKGVLKVN